MIGGCNLPPPNSGHCSLGQPLPYLFPLTVLNGGTSLPQSAPSGEPVTHPSPSSTDLTSASLPPPSWAGTSGSLTASCPTRPRLSCPSSPTFLTPGPHFLSSPPGGLGAMSLLHSKTSHMDFHWKGVSQVRQQGTYSQEVHKNDVLPTTSTKMDDPFPAMCRSMQGVWVWHLLGQLADTYTMYCHPKKIASKSLSNFILASCGFFLVCSRKLTFCSVHIEDRPLSTTLRPEARQRLVLAAKWAKKIK